MTRYNGRDMKSLQLTKPHCLIMIGLPGSGKTSFASRFADTFSAPYLNAEKLQAGEATLQVAGELLAEICKTKQTIVYEGLGGSRVERASAAKLVRSLGYEPLFVWVQTDPQVAKQRVTKASRQAPARMNESEFNEAVSRFTPPNHGEKAVVLSGMHTYASQAKSVLKRLSADNPRPSGVAPRETHGRRLMIQ